MKICNREHSEHADLQFATIGGNMRRTLSASLSSVAAVPVSGIRGWTSPPPPASPSQSAPHSSDTPGRSMVCATPPGQHTILIKLNQCLLITTRVVLIRYFKRLCHSYWKLNYRLTSKICKYSVSNLTYMSHFNHFNVGKPSSTLTQH